MAAETTCMVVQSVEAYVEKDEEKAKEVIAHDDIIDDLFIKSREDVISLIRSNPEEGACATDLLMIAKYFERIGDHACNIAEWVIFSITGEHKKKYERKEKNILDYWVKSYFTYNMYYWNYCYKKYLYER